MPSDLEARAVVPHDSLNPIRSRIQGGAIGRAITMFQPLLHRAHGCEVYTAVDDSGNISGGLQDSGNVRGGCRDTSKGQTYVRAAWHRGKFAIMYAWYWPKDHPASGRLVGGHRHDWESVVVWLDNPANPQPRLLGAAASAHGNYKRNSNPNKQGNNVKVEIFIKSPDNHALQFTNTVGRTFWINDWDTMPNAAKHALGNARSFGEANVPFRPDNFFRNLDEAFL
ncbi:similar to necrosis-and ethylene-inducing protein 1 precursor [Plenodomus lingam JN3]|uniref:Similar to necrosis-and ethylene-inducing protein 1 n=2 Tax=Leptosphaeria maculans TaxID=5022 RepID=E4ZH25_LEPMJ|nr:similar to necrosis-and ethylene-inducing protein 1 precursor [Plenodomus lingam JN3]CBX90595.1 similar to necrosis-and ethylene-inducing protein 1 precursor [Plenodomus lingam JN3]